ncbi:hypothetical protein H9P43_004090 [Blastocladiella emersonii ATCC 22665]|nr:hypothetical protein H9P43_004090 [Blastocladiella emersonii ATCC 22665]
MLITADESLWRSLLARHAPDLAPVVFACLARHSREFRMRDVYRVVLSPRRVVAVWGTGAVAKPVDPPLEPGYRELVELSTSVRSAPRQVACTAHAVFVVHGDGSVWMLGRLRKGTKAYRGRGIGRAWTQRVERVVTAETAVAFQCTDGRWYVPRGDGDMDAELVPAEVGGMAGGGGGSALVFRDAVACVKLTGNDAESVPCTHRRVHSVGHTDALGAVIATGCSIYPEPLSPPAEDPPAPSGRRPLQWRIEAWRRDRPSAASSSTMAKASAHDGSDHNSA